MKIIEPLEIPWISHGYTEFNFASLIFISPAMFGKRTQLHKEMNVRFSCILAEREMSINHFSRPVTWDISKTSKKRYFVTRIFRMFENIRMLCFSTFKHSVRKSLLSNWWKFSAQIDQSGHNIFHHTLSHTVICFHYRTFL